MGKVANKNTTRHLCIRCGRKRVEKKLEACPCGKSHWCREGCVFTEDKQWKKWHSDGRVKVYM